MLAKLPTSRDAFYDLALTAPGMFEGSGAPSQTTEFQSPTAYGSATNENVFLINGVDATSPRAGSFGALVNVNYDSVEEVRIVATGSKAEYASFSGAAIDVLTKSGSNVFHGTGAFYSKLGSPPSNQPDAQRDLRDGLPLRRRGRAALRRNQEDWETSATRRRADHARTSSGSSARSTTCAAPACRRAGRCENESWGRYADAKVSAAPFKNQRAWVSYHYENNDGNGWSWGSEPQWDTTMTYGAQDEEPHRRGAVAVAPEQQDDGAARSTSGSGPTTSPMSRTDAPDHPGYINWWKWADYGINGAFPYVEAQKSSRQTFQADMSHFAEEFLGQHDIKFGVQYTKGRGNWQGGYFQNYVNFLYPYRWTQSVGEHAGLVRRHRAALLQQQGHAQSVPDRTHGRFDRAVLRRSVVHYEAPDSQSRAPLRPDDDEVRRRARSTTSSTRPRTSTGRRPSCATGQSTGNIYDFKTWGPRLGLTYMLTEDGKTVARASYGRYYQPISVETLRRFGPDMPLRATDDADLPGRAVELRRYQRRRRRSIRSRRATRPRRIHGLTPISRRRDTDDPSWTLNVADDLKNQYTDQFTLNFERRGRPEPGGQRVLHLQARGQSVRQHPHQRGDRPGMGLRADTVHDVRRPAGDAV